MPNLVALNTFSLSMVCRLGESLEQNETRTHLYRFNMGGTDSKVLLVSHMCNIHNWTYSPRLVCVTALEAKCETLEKCNKLLMDKTEDLKSRTRRQNLRMLGIPENSEGPQITSFMTQFFAETLDMDIPDGPEMLDRAYRLASRPGLGANAPPRPMIVRVHHFRVKQHILQRAREKGPLSFRGQPVHIFPDFTTEVASRRASLNNIKQKLRTANIRYGLLFPARLWITFNGGRYSFTAPEDAEKFYMDTIAPALPTREPNGT